MAARHPSRRPQSPVVPPPPPAVAARAARGGGAGGDRRRARRVGTGVVMQEGAAGRRGKEGRRQMQRQGQGGWGVAATGLTAPRERGREGSASVVRPAAE